MSTYKFIYNQLIFNIIFISTASCFLGGTPIRAGDLLRWQQFVKQVFPDKQIFLTSPIAAPFEMARRRTLLPQQRFRTTGCFFPTMASGGAGKGIDFACRKSALISSSYKNGA
ncbi:MAG: hypothetical protein LBT71_06040 [Azoarcus sp.]|nr:hypothetical protein [Azoarcus sp.]